MEREDRVGLLERVFVVAALIMFSGAVILVIRSTELGSGFDATEGDPLLQVVWLTIYLITLFLMVRRWRSSLNIVHQSLTIWLLVGWAIISPLWSSNPQVSIRRSIALVGTTLFGLYFAARFDLHKQVNLLSWAMGFGVISSMLMASALPKYGIDPASGYWQGAFISKNGLGRAMTLAVVVFLLLSWRGWLRKAVFGSLTVCALVLLLGAGSAAALIILPLLLLSLIGARTVLRHQLALSVPLFVMMMASASALGLWVADHLAVVLGEFGKDPTFTGRTELWSDVIIQIEKRPWLGYGYGGFWLGWSGPSAQIWEITNWQPPHAHNGILDLWLDLGLIGIALFVVGFMFAISRAVVLAHKAHSKAELWPLLFLLFMSIYNLSESTILRQNTVFWVLYVAVFASVSRKYSIGRTWSKGFSDSTTRPDAVWIVPENELGFARQREVTTG